VTPPTTTTTTTTHYFHTIWVGGQKVSSQFCLCTLFLITLFNTIWLKNICTWVSFWELPVSFAILFSQHFGNLWNICRLVHPTMVPSPENNSPKVWTNYSDDIRVRLLIMKWRNL
jgi:hypothetical protein